MRRRWIATLLGCAAAVALGACDGGTNEVDAGKIERGSYKRAKARAYVDEYYLESCSDAWIYSLRGPDGRGQPLGENIEAYPDGIVRSNDRGECVVEVHIEALPTADLGPYELTVGFTYYYYRDPYRYLIYGYMDFDVVVVGSD